MFIVAQIIHFVIRLIILLVIVQAVLSYFMSPYDPIRQRIDRWVAPLLDPIRRVVPPLGGRLDISPIILIILLQVLDYLLSRLLLFFFG
jgi:YggT family protein